jgi:hypothetical protein
MPRTSRESAAKSPLSSRTPQIGPPTFAAVRAPATESYVSMSCTVDSPRKRCSLRNASISHGKDMTHECADVPITGIP